MVRCMKWTSRRLKIRMSERYMHINKNCTESYRLYDNYIGKLRLWLKQCTDIRQRGIFTKSGISEIFLIIIVALTKKKKERNGCWVNVILLYCPDELSRIVLYVAKCDSETEKIYDLGCIRWIHSITERDVIPDVHIARACICIWIKVSQILSS